MTILQLRRNSSINLSNWLKIDLKSVNGDQIVISNKFKHSDDGFTYFIGYKEGQTVKPLSTILPQKEWAHKILQNGGKKCLS